MTTSGSPGREAVEAHLRHRGKIEIRPKVPVRGPEDLSLWYTPGVAAVSRAVAADPSAADDLTWRGGAVAVVSDGSRVLGLGDVGPAAALPVMEGKALLFRSLGAVDAVPLCIDVHDEAGVVAFVQAIAPSFGGVNLEDIATPKCFRILEALQETLPIPVWHDDQQGTAAAALAGLRNALSLTGRRLEDARITLIGAGAANVAVYRLLRAAGADPARVLACDSRGLLHADRDDISADRVRLREKWAICRETNPGRRAGGVREALVGADVCIAFSAPGPNTISEAAIAGMAEDPIVFACANPVPEIAPEAARRAGAAIVATGRGDHANQVNNALVFPGVFRGVLDVRAPRITEEMALAAADALAALTLEDGLSTERILPSLHDPEAAAAVAEAVAREAVRAGGARRPDRADGVRRRTRRRLSERPA